MPVTTANGIRIAYDDTGDEEPALLFLPGWCVNRSVFRDLLSRTSEHCRSLSLDWPAHGESAASRRDFGSKELLQTAAAVIEASAADRVVPVALSHSGWVALELRRRLGRRIPKLVLLDWLVTEAPADFLEMLPGMQSAELWKQTVEETLSMWLHGVDNPDLKRFVQEEIAAYGREMWARAAREISFTPARINERPVSVWGGVTFRFKISAEDEKPEKPIAGSISLRSSPTFDYTATRD